MFQARSREVGGSAFARRAERLVGRPHARVVGAERHDARAREGGDVDDRVDLAEGLGALCAALAWPAATHAFPALDLLRLTVLRSGVAVL